VSGSSAVAFGSKRYRDFTQPRRLMFILTTLVYPLLLELLCVGTGLLLDRFCGRFIPAVLLPAIGAAGLVAVSQLTTYAPVSAPATPFVIAAIGTAGILLEWRRLKAAVLRSRSWRWQLWLPAIVYGLAVAPVLAFGQTTFSAYNVLTDSAVHMMGADYLIRHGQDYAHLDLHNSYGIYLRDYYGSGYPSGADTLFGGSAFLLGAPLIWAFQPFNGFMLALAAGPAWLLARRAGLSGGWAALAGLTATLTALVYGYELIGSVKEITGLPLILALGALIVMHERWLPGPPRRAVPFALTAAAGVSVLGVGFGAWILASVVILVAAVTVEISAGRNSLRRVGLLALAGVVVAGVAAWPTWSSTEASFRGAQGIASTSSSGDLTSPLKLVQVFGIWLSRLYTLPPTGVGAALSYVAIAITALAGAAGAIYLWRSREAALLGWLTALLALGGAILAYATTWIDAKTLMLSSPIVLLLAWSGVAALLRWRQAPLAGLLALVLTAGVLGSDVMQYRATDLAPPTRYAELASLDGRFAGRGPTLFTDWDEYALYELRNLDVGGPDFLYPPPALADVAPIHSAPVHLDRIAPRKFLSYPLIITRINPLASRPPAAYRLLWRGTYYELWARRPRAPAALIHLALRTNSRVRCQRIAEAARVAQRHHGYLVAAVAPTIVSVDLRGASSHNAYQQGQLSLTSNPSVSVTFRVSRGGRWDLWLRGEIMPAIVVEVDGRLVAKLADQLDGNDFNPDTIGPLRLRLARGRHVLTFAAAGSILSPGAAGEANVGRVFLTTPAGARQERLRVARATAWRSLCGGRYEWVEAVPRRSRRAKFVKAARNPNDRSPTSRRSDRSS
jgi:hypothetical protein